MVSVCRKAVKWTTRAFSVDTSQFDSVWCVWLVWKRISVLYFAPTTHTSQTNQTFQTDSCPQQNSRVKAPSEYHRDVIQYIDKEIKHDWAQLGVDRLLAQNIRENIILDTTIRPWSPRANLMCCCLWTYDIKYFGYENFLTVHLIYHHGLTLVSVR